MFKFIFILLILFGAALYFPQTRPVVVDTLGPIINPILAKQTRAEMDRIVRELHTVEEEGSTLPAPGARFQRWMDREFFGRAKLDAWGVAYTLELRRDALFLVSNGPDKEAGTPDDITQLVMNQRRR